MTLDVIADLLRAGDEVRVVDRNSGEDITAVTLSQILLDMERNRRSPIPEPLLVDMVKERGEQLIGMIRQSLSLPREIRQRAAGGLERGVDEVMTTGLHNLNIATQEELIALEAKVDSLAAKVDALLEGQARPPRRRSNGTRGG